MSLDEDNITELKNKYPLYKWEANSTLRQKSKAIDDIDESIINFGRQLLALMEEYEWAWLAAPQVGRNIRMIAVGEYDKNKLFIKSKKVLINPKIVYKSKKTQTQKEGCLSLPGIDWKVERPQSIKVEYTSLDKTKETLLASWLNASVVLHEIDHLDGVLFIDKLEDENAGLDFGKFI